MKRAAVYMRVSTARQEEEQTIENQFMELKQRVSAEGDLLLPDCVYKDEGWTGAIIERPGLDRMRSDAREGKFEILYFYDRGRISRRFVHQEIVFDDLRQANIEFVSLHDINGTSPEESLMGNVMGMFHEYEKLKITERMRLGKFRKVKENRKLLGYNPKYGYDYHHKIKTGANAQDGYFTVNERQAAVVRQIFTWIDEGLSKHVVRQKLHELGALPPKGRREMWSGGTLDRLLRDSTYYGDHFYNKSESVPTRNFRNPELKYRKTVNGSRKPRPKEEWLLIKVPPIISKDLFDRVQTKLTQNKRLNNRNNKKNYYLLAGLVECTCGKARTGDPGANNHTYYRCTDRLSKFPLPRECHERGINSEVLDAIVWQKLLQLLTSPPLLQQQAERWQSKASPLLSRIRELETQIKALEDEERRYTKAYGRDIMSERLYKENMSDVAEKKSRLQTELNQAQKDLASTPSLSVEQLVAGAKELLQSLDLTDKKYIVRKIIDKIVATQKEATIWGHVPVLVPEKVGYELSNRHRRPSQRR